LPPFSPEPSAEPSAEPSPAPTGESSPASEPSITPPPPGEQDPIYTAYGIYVKLVDYTIVIITFDTDNDVNSVTVSIPGQWDSAEYIGDYGGRQEWRAILDGEVKNFAVIWS
jgi:hypothetical protein